MNHFDTASWNVAIIRQAAPRSSKSLLLWRRPVVDFQAIALVFTHFAMKCNSRPNDAIRQRGEDGIIALSLLCSQRSLQIGICITSATRRQLASACYRTMRRDALDLLTATVNGNRHRVMPVEGLNLRYAF